jgi:two-component system, NarL family, sensor kinase
VPLRGLAVAKLTTDELRESEQQYRVWFEDNPLPMWFFDPQTYSFLEVNDAAVRHYGYSHEEFLAMTIKDIRPPECIPVLVSLMHARNRGRTQKALAQHRTKDGRLLDVEIYAQQGLWAGRRAELVQVHDITDRKRAEEGLRYLSGRLLQLQDEQKRRIALELHDAVGQTLTALLANLAMVTDSCPGMQPKPSRLLKESVGMAEQALNEIRTLSYLLHPPLLDEEGIAAALEIFLEGFAKRSGVKVNLAIPDSLGRLSQELETTLFRLVQEALTNVHRHSGSATAEVCMFRHESSLVLEVRDCGRGVGPDAMENIYRGARLGVGIAGMRERVAQLGGYLAVESKSGGTVIRATFPLHLNAFQAA